MYLGFSRRNLFTSQVNWKTQFQLSKAYDLHNYIFWNQIAQCNESNFNLFGQNDRQESGRPVNEAYQTEHLEPTVNYNYEKLMVSSFD